MTEDRTLIYSVAEVASNVDKDLGDVSLRKVYCGSGLKFESKGGSLLRTAWGHPATMTRG